LLFGVSFGKLWEKGGIMIPKSKRRKIIINGVEYEYCISGFVSIYIKNLATKQQTSWYLELKPKWGVQFSPKDIKEIILNGELMGVKARVSTLKMPRL